MFKPFPAVCPDSFSDATFSGRRHVPKLLSCEVSVEPRHHISATGGTIFLDYVHASRPAVTPSIAPKTVTPAKPISKPTSSSSSSTPTAQPDTKKRSHTGTTRPSKKPTSSNDPNAKKARTLFDMIPGLLASSNTL